MTGGLKGADELKKLAGALKEASDHDLTNRVRSAMRGEAKPLGVRVLSAGADRMPRRGGFAQRVRGGSRIGATSALVTGALHVTLTLNNKGADLKSLDAGVLRHPVFARSDRKRIWRSQAVPAKEFTKAFEKESPIVARQVLSAMQTTLNVTARKA